MKKFRQARCPHCGKKLGLLRSWAIKTQGEYKCRECGGISNIELDPAIHIFAILAVILSGLIYVFLMLAFRSINLVSIAIMAVPYLGFYILSIFLVRLRKLPVRKRPAPGNAESGSTKPIRLDSRGGEKSNFENTIIMDNLRQY